MSAALYREFPMRTPAMWTALVAFVRANWQACTDKGTPMRIIVTSEERSRNAEQNRRLWGYLYKNIAEQAWIDGRQYNKDVWHEYFARKYGVLEDLILPTGEVVSRRKSTSDMKVGEFAEFMNQIEAEAGTELGVVFE